MAHLQGHSMLGGRSRGNNRPSPLHVVMIVCLLAILNFSSGPSLGQDSRLENAVVIAPGDNIQRIVNSNPAGTTYLLQTGYHRENIIIPKDGDTFIGEDGAIISGARVLTDFQRSGEYWVMYGQVQEGQPGGICEVFAPRCRYGEDLYFDDQPLRHVDRLDMVRSGDFFFDYGANAIYFVDDPTNHVVEVAVTWQAAFDGTARNVTIENLIVEKYATRGQFGAIRGLDSDSWTVRNNIVRLNHGAGINVGNRMQVINNRVLQNGQIGISGKGTDILVEDNQIAYNNYAGFSYGWEAGGTKFVDTTNLVVRNNYVHNNIGPGIWTDINNIDALIENNIVVDNYQMGIFHEISYSAVIRNNVVKFNSPQESPWLYGGQIMISSSGDTEVYGNEITISEEGGNGITIIQQERGGGVAGPYVALNNHIHNNTIVHLGVTGQNGMASDVEIDESYWEGNLFDENTYYVPVTDYAAWSWENSRQDWQSFQAVGQEANGLLLDTLPDDATFVPEWQPYVTDGPPILTEALDPVVLPQELTSDPLTPRAVVGYVQQDGRVQNGLQVLYTFDAGDGNYVYDQSGYPDPIDLHIVNPSAVQWGDHSLRIIRSPFIISDVLPTRLTNAIRRSNAMTVEAWINPTRVDQFGPARIVTLSESIYSTNFTLSHGNVDGFTGKDFEIRMRTTATVDSGESINDVGQGRVLDGLMQVVYTYSPDGTTTIYINNEVVAIGRLPGDLENWNSDFNLLLGNEFTGDRPWFGEYYLVAIYDRALSQDEVAQNYDVGVSTIEAGLPAVLYGFIQANTNVNVRTAPDGSVFTAIAPGTEVIVLGNNEDNTWTHIALTDGREGWVATFLVNIP